MSKRDQLYDLLAQLHPAVVSDARMMLAAAAIIETIEAHTSALGYARAQLERIADGTQDVAARLEDLNGRLDELDNRAREVVEALGGIDDNTRRTVQEIDRAAAQLSRGHR